MHIHLWWEVSHKRVIDKVLTNGRQIYPNIIFLEREHVIVNAMFSYIRCRMSYWLYLGYRFDLSVSHFARLPPCHTSTGMKNTIHGLSPASTSLSWQSSPLFTTGFIHTSGLCGSNLHQQYQVFLLGWRDSCRDSHGGHQTGVRPTDLRDVVMRAAPNCW